MTQKITRKGLDRNVDRFVRYRDVEGILEKQDEGEYFIHTCGLLGLPQCSSLDEFDEFEGPLRNSSIIDIAIDVSGKKVFRKYKVSLRRI